MIYNSNFHNDYLRFYLEYGLIGLCLYIYFLISIIYKSIKFNKSDIMLVNYSLMFFLIGGIIISFFDNFYETHKFMFFAFYGFQNIYIEKK